MRLEIVLFCLEERGEVPPKRPRTKCVVLVRSRSARAALQVVLHHLRWKWAALAAPPFGCLFWKAMRDGGCGIAPWGATVAILFDVSPSYHSVLRSSAFFVVVPIPVSTALVQTCHFHSHLLLLPHPHPFLLLPFSSFLFVAASVGSAHSRVLAFCRVIRLSLSALF
eukprot:RCo053508